MSQPDNIRQINEPPCRLIYDPQRLKPRRANLLSDDILQWAQSCEPVTAGGRGSAWFIEHNKQHFVLRSYQRGGLVAKFNRQAYLGFGVESSRAFKEWRLLHWMHSQGLAVPAPVAASVCRWPGTLSPFYHAHILLQRIEDSQTLDQYLQLGPLDKRQWQNIGRVIRRFHASGIYHADLNANNILLDAQMKIYLIDFDKGERRNMNSQAASRPAWMQQNLDRLQRSLIKQMGIHPRYFFDESDWRALLEGYDNGF